MTTPVELLTNNSIPFSSTYVPIQFEITHNPELCKSVVYYHQGQGRVFIKPLSGPIEIHTRPSISELMNLIKSYAIIVDIPAPV
jgi:hypothetical protein